MKVSARVKKNTELFRAGNLSRFVAGPLETLREINGSVAAARVPSRPPRARVSNLHGFPETLVFLGKSMIPRGGNSTLDCEIRTLQGRELHDRYCSTSYRNALSYLVSRRLIYIYINIY